MWDFVESLGKVKQDDIMLFPSINPFVKVLNGKDGIHTIFLRKPCCVLDRILKPSSWSMIELHTICSSILHDIDVSEIGM